MFQLTIVTLAMLRMLSIWSDAVPMTLSSSDRQLPASDFTGNSSWSVEALWKTFKQRHGKALQLF